MSQRVTTWHAIEMLQMLLDSDSQIIGKVEAEIMVKLQHLVWHRASNPVGYDINGTQS
jgi:hypothetical protein